LTQLLILKLSFGVPKWLQAIPDGSNGPSEGSAKSGGLFNVQSDLRAHLARSEEASPLSVFPGNRPQSRPAKSIFIRPTVNRRARPLKKLAAGAEYRVPGLAWFFGKRRRPCVLGVGGSRPRLHRSRPPLTTPRSGFVQPASRSIISFRVSA
jgi:hypothetical protein